AAHGTTVSAQNVELFQFADGIRTAADLDAIIAGGTGNRDPIIAGGDTATVLVPENTTAVTTISATDPDGTPVTYSIARGADPAAFSIDPTTGAPAVVTAPDLDRPTAAGQQ